jgi:hypothetical protein
MSPQSLNARKAMPFYQSGGSEKENSGFSVLAIQRTMTVAAWPISLLVKVLRDRKMI